MNPQAERFVGLATRPLENNAELHLAAAGELRRQIEANSATPETLAEAADSLEHADRHPRRRYWRIALYLTTLLVSLPVLVHSARKADDFVYASDLNSTFGSLSGPGAESAAKNLLPQQKLLLFGDEPAANSSDRWKPLWNSEPENPAFLAQYASAYFSDHKMLSPEILDAAARIDPDNGWFIALSAGGIAEGVVTKEKQSDKEKKEFKTPVWKISDLEKLRETLSLIHQAAEKPRFNSHEVELLQQRIPLLPKRTDCVSQVPRFAYVASQTTAIIHLRKLVDALCAGAQECAAKQDIPGFRRIIGDWENLNRKQTENGLTLIDLLIARVFTFAPAETFRDAALSLGLDQEFIRFSKLHDRKKADKEARDQRRRGSPTDDLVMKRVSLFASLTIVPMVSNHVQSPPVLTDSDLRPSRYADHALFSRVISIFAWAFFGLCAGFAALHRFRQSPLVRSLSARMLDLLHPSDLAWVITGGMLLPIIWHSIIIHLTPLSSREWTLKFGGFLHASCQFGSMIVLMLILSVVLACSRLAKRGAPLGLTSHFLWLGWLAALSAAMALPAFGTIMLADKSGTLLQWLTPYLLGLAYALLGIPILWLIVGFYRNVLGTHAHALRRATLARMVLPAWIFGMLVMAVSVPFHYAEECHWIQQDRLFGITADAPAMSRYEWDVARQLRKELLEMMD